MKITNDKGRTFLVRVVYKGDKWGLRDCLTHDKDDPLIEFYDLTNPGPVFGPRGQFVSSYFASTLADTKGDCGLCLDGGIPEWVVDSETMRPVRELARDLASKYPRAYPKLGG